MQNFTPQWSQVSHPALNSMQFWILLFLLLFLFSSLEVLNLNSQPHMSMTAMWRSRCMSLQARKLSCCLSHPSHFGWTLTEFICGQKEICFVWGQGEEGWGRWEQLLIPENTSGKSTRCRQRESVCSGVHGRMQAKECFPGRPGLWMLWEKLPNRDKMEAGIQKPCA